MDKKHFVIRLAALIFPGVLIWLLVQELVGAGEDDFTAPALAGFIAIGITGLAALLVWNRPVTIQILTAAAICVLVVVGHHVLITRDPVRQIKNILRGSWKSIPAEGQGSGTVTLDFVNDHDVAIGISNVHTCKYEITRNQHLVIVDNFDTTNSATTTYEILNLQKDSLQLKMEFEILQFARQREAP
jgi:hypothetical protein